MKRIPHLLFTILFKSIGTIAHFHVPYSETCIEHLLKPLKIFSNLDAGGFPTVACRLVQSRREDQMYIWKRLQPNRGEKRRAAVHM